MALLQLLDEVRELRDGVIHAHVLVRVPGTEAQGSFGFTNSSDHSVYNVERKPRTIFD